MVEEQQRFENLVHRITESILISYQDKNHFIFFKTGTAVHLCQNYSIILNEYFLIFYAPEIDIVSDQYASCL